MQQSGAFWFHTVDGRIPAPPKKAWNDDPPVKSNRQWLPIVAKCCEMDFVHPQNHHIFSANPCRSQPLPARLLWSGGRFPSRRRAPHGAAEKGTFATRQAASLSGGLTGRAWGEGCDLPKHAPAFMLRSFLGRGGGGDTCRVHFATFIQGIGLVGVSAKQAPGRGPRNHSQPGMLEPGSTPRRSKRS